MAYREDNYERAVIDLFQSSLGYSYVYGPNVSRDYHSPFYSDELEMGIRRLNPHLPENAIEEALRKIKNIEGDDLVRRNKTFTYYLQNGMTISYFQNGKQRYELVYLVDYENLEKNSFILANQWSFIEYSSKRPDLVVFLNGIPIVVFELKSPSREETNVDEAYLQLRNYMNEIPTFFVYNAFCVLSDMTTTTAGTITAGLDRFMEWKSKDGEYENHMYGQFDTFFEGIFKKERLLDILKNFICFSGDTKIMSAYHQYFAVNKAIESTKTAAKTDGKGGVFWHTQGSGKSLSMVFYAHLLQDALSSPTIVVLTDRNDLDNQLFEQFAKCSDFLRQSPEQAQSREHLKTLLAGRKANGIIFSTAQKFEEGLEVLSERRNIVVMTDEAHRSQFIDQRADKWGRLHKSMGLVIRESLPNATYIGFTGTPISTKDRSTVEVFGNYIDIYDMTQAVRDGATRPVFYESRVVNLKLDPDILKLIDAEYEIMAMNAEPYVIEKSKQKLSRMENILGAPETIDTLCKDIIKHYEENRQYELTGKAMIVAYNRAIAMKIYKRILELRPNWDEKIALVMTQNNDDPEEWREIIGNKRHRDELANVFKDNNSPLKIAIVVDMWLTGFDLPSLATMYIYKPMRGHTLMQAIARVNRVYEDKEGGLIVDYVGIANALKEAMNDYTKRDQDNYGEMDVAKVALPKFIEKLEVCRDLLYGYDYSAFLSDDASDLTRAKTISGAANFLSEIKGSKMLVIDDNWEEFSKVAEFPEPYGEDKTLKEHFIKEAFLLKRALSLCRSLLTPEQRLEAAFFEAVRTMLTRIGGGPKKLSLKEVNKRINEILKEAVNTSSVINLFSELDTGLSIFSEKFLADIARMKEKNIAVELLKQLLNEQVKVYKRTNLVKSEKFSEMLNRTMKTYLNGMISNEEVIKELIRMANEIKQAQTEGNKLGLTDEELAFYDAITEPAAIKDFYTNEELVQLTRELTESLRKSRTIDWQKKASARAGMRRRVKKLLKKYKYPPEGMEEAVKVVIQQCELWADT